MNVPAWFADLLQERLLGIAALSAAQIGQLYRHYALLVRWNEKINLTAVRAPEEIVVRHYCESLFFGVHLPDGVSGTTVVDLGSGAGFPGFPTAVLRPDCRVTLVESHQRKTVFLRESTRGLDNIVVEGQRAEVLLGSYDWVVSRAVRVEDVLEQVPRLGGRVGLLMGEADLETLKARADIVWQPPVKVPWGERRVCSFGCST